MDSAIYKSLHDEKHGMCDIKYYPSIGRFEFMIDKLRSILEY